MQYKKSTKISFHASASSVVVLSVVRCDFDMFYYKSGQWRSQECELGASPPLPPFSPPLPLPLLTGVRGYNPRNFFKLKVLVGEF